MNVSRKRRATQAQRIDYCIVLENLPELPLRVLSNVEWNGEEVVDIVVVAVTAFRAEARGDAVTAN